jgi:NAD(P)-dependent dehydrogenase (short-subunit alcohol dehydrogenase family)
MRGLAGKVCIVAGGAPGNIGGATAQRLLEEGAKVVVGDLNADAAMALADQLTPLGDIVGTAVDISQEESFKNLIEVAVDRFGTVDSLFNVAADLSAATIGADSSHTALDIPIEVWQHTIDVTLTGYLFGIRAALPIMLEKGSGSIVNTMSAAVWMAEPVRVAYASAKSGVEALTHHIATIAGKQGVRCNAIAPGTVRTAANIATMTPDEVEKQIAAVRSPRLGTTEDIAAAVAFLFSEDASWINGQTLLIDGGAIIR